MCYKTHKTVQHALVTTTTLAVTTNNHRRLQINQDRLFFLLIFLSQPTNGADSQAEEIIM